MRRKKRGKEIRNLIVLSIVFIGAIALVLLINTIKWSPTTILPPESPEIIAKRQSPDNAYYTLIKAYELLPPKPQPLYLNEHGEPDPRGVDRYQPEPGSIGELLNIRRPDNDPEMIAYLEQCQPALDLAVSALEQKYFLFPIVPIEEEHASQVDNPQWLPNVIKIYTLTSLMISNYTVAFRQKEYDKGLECLNHTIRLLGMLLEEGDIFYYYNIMHKYKCALQCILDFIPTVSDPQIINKIQDIVAKHEDWINRPLGLYIEFRWREIDGEQWKYHSDDFESRIIAFLTGLSPGQGKNFIIKNRGRFLEAASLLYSEFMDRNQKDYADLDNLYFSITDIKSMLISRAKAQTWRAGVIITTALERYCHEHGGYPDQLEQLVPTYLDAIPNDGFYEKPFQYRRVEKSYWLYSVGEDGKDDGGTDQSNNDCVIHQPVDAISTEESLGKT